MKFSKTRSVKIVMLGAGGTGGHIAPHLYRLLYALDRPVRFIICDGEGTDYICRLSPKGDGSADIIETRPTQGEPTVAVTVFAAFSKGDRPEFVVQKCVELGAREIVFFPSARCVSRPDGAALI